MYTLVCPICGNTFQDSHSNRKYCSYACNNKSRHVMVENTCEVCNSVFLTRPGARRKFCCRECADISHRHGTEQICPICGKSFWVYLSRKKKGETQYCSHRCYAKSRIKPVVVQCKNCGKPITKHPSLAKKTFFCSRHCYIKYRGETYPERRVKEGLMTLGIIYIPQHPIGLYTIDFYLPIHRIALEVDGVYWHQKQTDNDAKRDEKLLRKGIETVRITDKEIAKISSTQLVSLLRKRLKL